VNREGVWSERVPSMNIANRVTKFPTTEGSSSFNCSLFAMLIVDFVHYVHRRQSLLQWVQRIVKTTHCNKCYNERRE